MIKDGDWELFDYDFRTGRTVWRWFDGKDTHFRTEYPVDNILKLNSEAFNESHGTRWGDGRRVASIPLNTFFDELQEAQNQQDDRYLNRWLNDADNRKFRTYEGRL